MIAQNKVLRAFDMLIDDRIEQFGLHDTIIDLLDAGLDTDDLLELRFDEKDIVKAIKAIEEREEVNYILNTIKKETGG